MSLFLPVFAALLALGAGGFVAFLLFLLGQFLFRVASLATDDLLSGDPDKR